MTGKAANLQFSTDLAKASGDVLELVENPLLKKVIAGVFKEQSNAATLSCGSLQFGDFGEFGEFPNQS